MVTYHQSDVHKQPGSVDDLGFLGEVITKAFGRPAERAICIGADRTPDFHMMAFGDNSEVEVYVRRRDAEGLRQLERLKRTLRTMEIPFRPVYIRAWIPREKRIRFFLPA